MRRGDTAGRIATALLMGALALAVPASARGEHNRLELITTGPGPQTGPSYHNGALFSSLDGRRVLFNTVNDLVPEDVDRCEDFDPESGETTVFPCNDGYERFNGVTTLLTTGPTDPQFNNHMELIAASNDGTRAFFTGGPLLPGDPSAHIYERHNGVTTALPTGPLGPNPAFAGLTNVSEDGRHAFFATTNRLVPEDTDNCEDFYESFDGTARLASTAVPMVPTSGGNLECAELSRLGISADGSRLFLTSRAAITSDDTDTNRDIYEWSGGEVLLVSTGPADGPAGGSLQEVAVSRDGRRVVFGTTEQLVDADTDTEKDLYVRFDSQTRLVAPAIDSDTSPRVDLAALSADGSRVIAGSQDRLSGDDTDGQPDLYSISDRSAQLLSIGPSGGNGDCPPSEFCSQFWARYVGTADSLPPSPMSAGGAGGASEDARVVLFSTAERLVPEDADAAGDLYAKC